VKRPSPGQYLCQFLFGRHVSEITRDLRCAWTALLARLSLNNDNKGVQGVSLQTVSASVECLYSPCSYSGTESEGYERGERC
jgi:hypothetical protein